MTRYECTADIKYASDQELLHSRIYDAIFDERQRQEDLYPTNNVRLSTLRGDLYGAFVVLNSEASEARHAETSGDMVAELVQVAACAVGMIEGLLSQTVE